MLLHRDDGYTIDTAPERLDTDRIDRWLATDTYWAIGRSPQDMATSRANSICYGVYAPDGEQVGFARAVTDFSTFAWVCDVYIDRAVRGVGLGTWLARSIVDDIRGRGVPRLLLATADAHDIYRKAGFVELARPESWMEIDLRPIFT
jgi:GNAT superfamily N-acetyltransferase